MITMKLDNARTTRAFDVLRDNAPKAIARAINRSAASAKVPIARDTGADMALKVGRVKDRVFVRNATWQKLSATITADAQKVPLVEYSAKGPFPTRGKGAGVTANTGRGRKVYPHTFLAQTASGHRGVFQRSGNKRLPIQQTTGPSVAHVAAKMVAGAIDRYTEQLGKNIDHEIDFELQRAAKGT
jgi:hypothetical protein